MSKKKDWYNEDPDSCGNDYFPYVSDEYIKSKIMEDDLRNQPCEQDDYDYYGDGDDFETIDYAISNSLNLSQFFDRFIRLYIQSKISLIGPSFKGCSKDNVESLINLYKSYEVTLENMFKELSINENKYWEILNSEYKEYMKKYLKEKLKRRTRAENRIVKLYTKENKTLRELAVDKSILEIHPDYYNKIPKTSLKEILKSKGVKIDLKREKIIKK